MKKINKTIAFAFCQVLFIALRMDAQTASDALRYANLQAGGTARTIAIGGSIGALGGDFSTVSSNPAGLAIFRKGEFQISPNFYGVNTKSKLTSQFTTNNELAENGGAFRLSNIGLVITSKPKNRDWTQLNFAIGMNNMSQYKSEQYYEGKSRGTVTDKFVEQANNGNFDPFYSKLAVDAGAIYQPKMSTTYINDFVQIRDELVAKNQVINTSGSTNDLSFAFAGNYKEKLMVGLTVGVPILRYKEEKIYKEINDGLNTPFNSLTFKENFETSGAGINAKLGVIYKANKFLRIGAAVHTPTRYSLEDKYSNILSYSYEDTDNTVDNTEESPGGNYKYNLVTPWRALGSLGLVFGKSGFFTAEVEYVDYASSSFQLDINDKDYERTLNNQIQSNYKNTINLKFGAEYAYEVFRVRAGYALYGNPYTNNSNIFGNSLYSVGAGVRGNHVYLDLAYQFGTNSDSYLPYTTVNAVQQLVERRFTTGNVVATLGFKF